MERVIPGVLGARDEPGADNMNAVDAHVRYTTDLLVERSAVIAERLAAGRCAVVGLGYRLAEGSVRQVASRGL